MTLKEIKDYYKSVFYIEDDFIIDIVIATTLGMYTNGDPIWLMIVGGSSSGKSELVNMVSSCNKVFSISNITENTFLSGARPTEGKETSLLRRIGKRGVIIMKDYTSILAMRSEKREIISSQMREIYDGSMVKETGNGVNPSWTGKINFIGGVTDSIYSSEGESAGMGRRAVMYCLPQQDRKKTLKRSKQNTNDGDEKREKIKMMVKEYITEMSSKIPITLPPLDEELSEEIMNLADFSTLARSPVERDYRGTMTLVHDAEMPMRVSQQLHLLAQILNFMYEGDIPENIRHGVMKIAFDNIPKLRKNTLFILSKYRRVTSKGVAQEVDYPTETAKVWLEDLNALKITKRSIHGATHMDLFQIKQEHRDIILKYHPEITYIDDDLLGTEESVDQADTSSIDSLIIEAAQKKSQVELLEF